MFEKDEKASQLKSKLKQSGQWNAETKAWLSDYKKARKNLRGQIIAYHEVKKHLIRIMDEARHLELILQEGGDFLPQHQRRMQSILADFEATGPKLTSEFLVSQADQGYLSSLKALRGMEGHQRDKGDLLLYQSEVENLIHMTREVMEREKPDLFRVAWFDLRHSDSELSGRPYEGRLELVDQVFERECLEKIRPVLEGMMGKEQAADYLNKLFSEKGE